MSGVVHPVGPKPAKVYWQRRAIFALVLIVTLIAISQALFGGSGSSGKPTAQVVVSKTASAHPSASPSVSPSASASATSTPASGPTIDPITQQSPTPIVTPTQPAGACSDSQVSVQVKLRPNKTKVGSGMDLTMSVKNISNQPCKRDVGSGANEVTIISGPALVWSTDHCNPATDSNYVKLAPSQTWSVHVIWDGKLSEAGCKILANAEPGAYWAHARNGAVVSTGSRFVIE